MPARRPQASQQAPAARALRDGERLDLNRADAASLELLPGIGPALAGRIVRYRREHGAFREARDLIGVRGIGERRLEALRGLVEVSEPPPPDADEGQGAPASPGEPTLAPDGDGG